VTTLALLARSGIKQVSVETPETVADRIRRALPPVDPGRLYPSTDFGLVPRSRAAARGKLRALAAGAAIVRPELQGRSAGVPHRG
jgi:5-methyltetrahydropteroyltriglutamate--homocysteine methyltransferase